jgi:hypothetical protein
MKEQIFPFAKMVVAERNKATRFEGIEVTNSEIHSFKYACAMKAESCSCEDNAGTGEMKRARIITLAKVAGR